MSKRDNFTADRVASYCCEPGKSQSIYWDGKTPGLGLRVTAKGAKAYIFESRLHGATIRMTIGDPAHWPLETQWRKNPETGESVEHRRGVRDEAGRIGALISQGIDPRGERAEKRAKAKALKERQDAALVAWNGYVAERSTKWSDRYKDTHAQMVREGGQSITRGKRKGMGDKKEPGPLRALLMLPLAEITRDKARGTIGELAEGKPETARLALALLRAFLTWTGDSDRYRDQVNANVCARLGKELPARKAKEDCLQREQLKLWFEKVRALTNKTQSAYLQCLLLTGARRGELAGLQWGDVDFQWKSLTIRDKVEGTRTIGLTPYVAALLLELKPKPVAAVVTPLKPEQAPRPAKAAKPAQDENDKPDQPLWVFASAHAESGRIQEPRIAHNKALASAGLPPLSIHGLRRSFGTLSEWVECPAGIAAQIMGHKPSATAEKHYRRRPLDLLRMWHTKIEGWILNEAGIQQPQDKAEKDDEAKAATAA